MVTLSETSPAGHPATSVEKIETMISELRHGAGRLVASSLEERIRLAQDCLTNTAAVAREWVGAAMRAKGVAPGSPAAAEEILTGPVSVLRYLQLMIRTFKDLLSHGRPHLPGKPQIVNGQLRIPTFPARSLYDPLVFMSLSAETWLQPDVMPDAIFGENVDRLARRTAANPRIVTVLGAGNVATIPATDALHFIFQEDSAVLLKMNPVNEYLGPLFERALQPLIRSKFLRILYGGVEQGRLAVNHPGIDAVHITGSSESHAAIVWGTGPDQQQRRHAGQPLIGIPVTSELGNVTPWAIVPGRYRDSQLLSQAESIVTSIVNNASFNCIATKMLITWKQWPARERFLNLIDSILARVPTRRAYYPGAFDRFATFSGSTAPPDEQGRLPWTLRRNVSPAREPLLFERESFVCVAGETTIDATSPVEFMHRAVELMNEQIWGTLAAALTVPDELRTKQSSELDAALRRLRYGTIGINQWSGVAYALMSPPWGAYPASGLSQVQSGLGFVHNTCLLNRPQKTILRSPLSLFPRPVWFSSNRRAEAISWKLCELYGSPSVWKLPGLMSQTLRG